MLIEINYRRPLIRTSHHHHHHTPRSFHRHHVHHHHHHLHHRSANPVLKHPAGCRVGSTVTKHSHYGTNDVNYENDFEFNCSSRSLQDNMVTSGNGINRHGISGGLECGSALCLMWSGTHGESLNGGSNRVCFPKLCASANQSASTGNGDVNVCLSVSHQVALEFPLTLSLGSSYSSHCVLYLDKTTSP